MSNIKYACGVVGGILGAFVGGWDGFTYALLVFVIIDYITGLLSAFKQKSVSSEIGFWGLIRKVVIFALVGIANILDQHILGTGSVLRTAIIFFFLSNEGVSILENSATLGIPVPQKLKEALAQLKMNEEDK